MQRLQRLGSVAWLLLCLASIVWSLCAAAGPQLYDSGELAAAALDLGGSHPPGQPLPSLLGHVWTWLPLGPIPLRLSLMSVACALGAAWAGGLLCAELCVELGFGARWRSACEAGAVLCILVAPPVLRQTLRIEVYTLALFLFLLGVLQLFRWARDAREPQLWSAATLAGLAACVHPPHALAIGVTAACMAVFQPRRLLGSPRTCLGGLVFGLLPLLMLVYLPVRARAGASMWGDPTTWSGFIRYVTAQAFLANVSQHNRLELLREYGGYALQLTHGLPFIGTLLLLLPGTCRDRPAVSGLLLGSLATLLTACLQPLEVRNPDNVAYLAPALALFFVLGLAGYASLAMRRQRTFAALGLLAMPQAGLFELPGTLHADLPALETLAAQLLDLPPPRGLVIAHTDFVASAWMMAQHVDRVRPDAAMFVQGLATSSWHWKQLAHHPALATAPRSAGQGSAHDRYTRGAILFATQRVPVLLEPDVLGIHTNVVRGPYWLLDPRGPDARATEVLAADQRAAQLLGREAAASPVGDFGAAAAIARNALYRRSLRLFQSGAAHDALRCAQFALFGLPAAERALLHTAQPRRVERMPAVYTDPRSYLISSEDAIRLAAAELWALDARDEASQLLRQQLMRGDQGALLQLAYLQAYDDDRAAALHSLATFEAYAPLPASASALRRGLQAEPH